LINHEKSSAEDAEDTEDTEQTRFGVLGVALTPRLVSYCASILNP
jgi:hypothetical protein